MLSEAIEVYRSARLADCEERAFMLTAVGVPSEIDHPGPEFVLLVDPHAASEAQFHLRQYEWERRPQPRPAPLPPPRLHPDAWVGCAIYAIALLWIAYAVSHGIGRLDDFSVGELYAAAMQRGEWWRAWTALTLHLGPAHLSANLGAGVWFGYLCGRVLGPGLAWALIVNGGACANLIEGLLAAPSHRAAGASTAVFTALGLLAAHTWSTRRGLERHWALGWGPLIAGVVLLGWLGTAGAHTDVFAHLAGFVVGGVLGVVVAIPAVRRVLDTLPQWLTGALAVAPMALAWLLALGS
ncbi:MAG: rhomboid family intramembrane serine protease [Steroidobacteraceae bacterium]